MATNVINIRRFVDVTTGVESAGTNVARDWGAFLFVQKGDDGAATKITKYENLAAVVAAGSNTEATKAATVFYGTSYDSLVPNSPFYVAEIGAENVEEFTKNFTALLDSEDYYLVGIDSNFDTDARKAAAGIMEASQATAAHRLFIEDYSADAANKTLEEDENSLAAYCKKNNYKATMVVWVNPTNENKYYGAAAASFFATRRFNNTKRAMASIAHKRPSGIAPVNLKDSNVTVTETQAFDNLDSKGCNVYANINIVGITAWERGNTPSGDDMSDFISADYLNYTITMSVFNALQNNARIPMNTHGAAILASAIEVAFLQLTAAGVIAGGTSLDGETFPATGYKLSIPIPTGVAKANGLWENINCSALLAGSAKKVVIGNMLKR